MPGDAGDVDPGRGEESQAGGGALQAEGVAGWRPHCLRGQRISGGAELTGGEPRGGLTYLTVSPAGPVSLTLSDPMTVSPEVRENKTRSVSSRSSNRPPRTFRPELSKEMSRECSMCE